MKTLTCTHCDGSGCEPNTTGEHWFDGDPCTVCRTDDKDDEAPPPDAPIDPDVHELIAGLKQSLSGRNLRAVVRELTRELDRGSQ